MLFKFKYHRNFSLIISFIILIGCQLQDPIQNHGIAFLENRSKKLILNKSNTNDILNIMGQPHTKSINNDNQWIYIERSLTKGEFHNLGQNLVKRNNILILDFDKYGVLKKKKLLSKDDLNNINFSEKETKNELTQKSFVTKFLQSVKSKMYGNR